jgi:hypothetical protein
VGTAGTIGRNHRSADRKTLDQHGRQPSKSEGSTKTSRASYRRMVLSKPERNTGFETVAPNQCPRFDRSGPSPRITSRARVLLHARKGLDEK